MPTANPHNPFSTELEMTERPRPPSPAPTYTSTFHGKHQTGTSSNNFPILPEPHDPTHPHYTLPPPPPPPPPTTAPLSHSRRLPSLKLIIPWTLATLFLLTTLYYTSIALGVRLTNSLQSANTAPNIHIHINGEELTKTTENPQADLPDRTYNGGSKTSFKAAEPEVSKKEVGKRTLVTVTRSAAALVTGS